MSDAELIADLRGKGFGVMEKAADRIEALKRYKKFILEERDRTFALMLARTEALTEQLEQLVAINEAARADAKETEAVEIDIRHVMMDEIEKAVAESPWVPAEYYMNEVVSDICDFLRSPRDMLTEIESSEAAPPYGLEGDKV